MRTTLLIPDRDVGSLGKIDRLVDMAQGRVIELYREGWGRLLRLGRSERSHILRTEHWISRDQAVLVRGLDDRWQVAHIPEASNVTRLNGLRVPDSPRSMAFEVGSLLRVGYSIFVATNTEQHDPGRWVIAASQEREFYCSALLVYGSFLEAAERIGIPETTFRDRIKRWAEQGDRRAQDALLIVTEQRLPKGKRRRLHPLPIATMAIHMEAIRVSEDG